MHKNTNTPDDIKRRRPGGKNFLTACTRKAKLIPRLAAIIAPIEKAIAG